MLLDFSDIVSLKRLDIFILVFLFYTFKEWERGKGGLKQNKDDDDDGLLASLRYGSSSRGEEARRQTHHTHEMMIATKLHQRRRRPVCFRRRRLVFVQVYNQLRGVSHWRNEEEKPSKVSVCIIKQGFAACGPLLDASAKPIIM